MHLKIDLTQSHHPKLLRINNSEFSAHTLMYYLKRVLSMIIPVFGTRPYSVSSTQSLGDQRSSITYAKPNLTSKTPTTNFSSRG